MSTFAQIYQEVGMQFDSQSTARVKLWVNGAAHDLYGRRRWSWLETTGTFATVNAQADYVLYGTSPVVPDFDGQISVRHNGANGAATYQKMLILPQQLFDDWFANAATNTGIPVFATFRGGPAQAAGAVFSGGAQLLSLWPKPGFVGSCLFGYFRSGASIEMVNDSDLPLAPPSLHQAITLLATARGLAEEDQMIQSNVFKGLAEALIQTAIAADVYNRSGDPAFDKPSVSGRLPAAPQIASPGQNPYGFDVST